MGLLVRSEHHSGDCALDCSSCIENSHNGDQDTWRLAFRSHEQSADGVAGEGGRVQFNASELIRWRKQENGAPRPACKETHQSHLSKQIIPWRPFGQVPVLQDGDLTLFESRAIIRYLCEKFPKQGTPLYGFTSADKALVEQWLEVESQVLQPIWRPLVSQLLGPRVWNTNKAPDEKLVAEHTAKLAQVLDVYEVQLAKHKYLAGDFVSIADLSHLPMTYYYFYLAKERDLLNSRKHVASWFEEISTRASWRKVLEQAAPFFQKWAK